jgi:dethiobiotin synthetase|tara:strand:+ start:12369 stop:13049 length:681 start_codon:yes stop_codon:yes gene_type:complete
MAKTYFVTGTDTDAGKTVIACGLLQAFANAGLTTAAVKPVAAGCASTDEGLRNDDALALMSVATQKLPYAQVNPIALKPAIAPHIAANQINRRLSISRLAGFCRGVSIIKVDKVLIEGAGGWRVPVNERETLAELPKELNIPVILVVGMKLGCINHAILTAEAICNDGCVLAGWVANVVDQDMAELEANFSSLQSRIASPCLGLVPYIPNITPADVAAKLTLNKLL